MASKTVMGCNCPPDGGCPHHQERSPPPISSSDILRIAWKISVGWMELSQLYVEKRPVTMSHILDEMVIFRTCDSLTSVTGQLVTGLSQWQNHRSSNHTPPLVHTTVTRYSYGQRFRLVRFVNERFKASFLPMWHMADINNHIVSDCTREVRTEGSRRKCTCFTPNPFNITGTVLIWQVSVCVPGVLSINISLRRCRSTPAQRLI